MSDGVFAIMVGFVACRCGRVAADMRANMRELQRRTVSATQTVSRPRHPKPAT
jgi:hypothetical protein